MTFGDALKPERVISDCVKKKLVMSIIKKNISHNSLFPPKGQSNDAILKLFPFWNFGELHVFHEVCDKFLYSNMWNRKHVKICPS